MRAHIRTLLDRCGEYAFHVAAPEPDALCAGLTHPPRARHRIGIIEGAPHQDVTAAFQLARLAGRESYKLLHVHGVRAGWVAALARRLFGLRAPVLLTLHNEIPRAFSGPKGWVGQQFLRRALDAPQHVIAVSAGIARQFAALAPHRAGRVTYVPNGIDLERFAAAASSTVGTDGERRRRAHVFAGFGVPVDRPLIGTALRMIASKGLDLLVETIEALSRVMPNLHVVIAGDGPARADLERRIARLGLGERTHFLGWWKEMPLFFAGIDLLIFPSESEGLPLTILEAMAAGVPIAATAVGGIPDVIEDGVSGLLVSPHDPGKLAQAAHKLLSDGGFAARVAAAARAGAASFSADAMVRRTMEVYRSLCGAGM